MSTAAAPQSEHAVEAVGLTKRFAEGPQWPGRRPRPWRHTAVDNVDMYIDQGEIFGLVGPNGAGKTTLIKMLTTLLLPTSGYARVGGYDVAHQERHVRNIAGLVTANERSFYWRLSARQNLTFFASLYNIPRRQVAGRVDELLDMLGLAADGNKRFDAYSTGMRQRLAIARGLLSHPKFIFMDEPTKGVDPISRAHLETVIRDGIVGRWRPTILITSHNLDEIERLCARVALMSAGRIVASGTVDELRELATEHTRFHMEIANLSDERLHAIAASCAPTVPLELTHRNGESADVTIGFEKGSDGFASLVRGIVESGGDVLTCTREKETFDQVFHRLVSESEEAAALEDEA